MGIFNKKLSDEEREKEEVFGDVTSLRGQHKENQKKIKKLKKNMERKYFRIILLSLVIVFPILLGYDITNAINTDVWNPMTIEQLLQQFNREMLKTDIGFFDWLLSLPIFVIIGITFLVLIILF